MADASVKLIVGLGNPGPEYTDTRHNAGQWLVDALCRQARVSLSNDPRFFGYTARATLHGQDVRLLVPTTYMNLSGKAVGALAGFFKIAPEEILVVHDELDLIPGDARLKRGGSGGGNGVKDIQRAMGNNPNFLRLRLGIGRPARSSDVTGYVLGKPPASERDLIDQAIDKSLSVLPLLLSGDVARATHQLHTKG